MDTQKVAAELKALAAELGGKSRRADGEIKRYMERYANYVLLSHEIKVNGEVTFAGIENAVNAVRVARKRDVYLLKSLGVDVKAFDAGEGIQAVRGQDAIRVSMIRSVRVSGEAAEANLKEMGFFATGMA